MTAAVTMMPGGWPRPSVEDERHDNQLRVPRINTQMRQPTLRVPYSATPSSSRSNDELFFDTPQSSSIGITRTPSFLAFEPVVESVDRDQDVDWKQYEPPTELSRVQEGTSEELRGLIPRSIERVRTQLVEENERQAEAARERRPLARTRRASVPTIASLDPLSEAAERADLRSDSATSLVSNDSGYGSTLPEASFASLSGLPILPIPMLAPAGKGKHKSSFSLSSLFRRKDNTTFSLEIPQQHTSSPSSLRIPIPSMSQPSRVEVSTPAALAPEISVSDSGTRECVSCLDDFEGGDMIKLTCHSYCADCFQRLISTALEAETQWPVKCCLNTIPSETILPHLDATTKEKFEQRSAEWSIPTSDRIYCAHSGCNSWIPPKKVNKQHNTARCLQCSKRTCVSCRGVSHHGSDCPQDPALQQTISLAELEGWKRCYQCHAFVEHNKGCRHMTCRCKAEFCYICSARWRTCSCTDTQLVAAQEAAEVRRQQRATQEVIAAAEAARREAAAEEERILVQMVADFERDEAEREAAALEAQRLRDEEERRQREAERRRMEEERVAAIGLRFRQLTTELEGLNEVQRVFMIERYEFEVEFQRKQRQDALDRFALSHPSELETLTRESDTVIFDAEYAYRQEYRMRLSEEQRIEEEYVQGLKLYWNGKPDGEYKIREARDELRHDQDKEYRFWDAYRKKQIFAIKEGEKRKMEALMVKHANEISEIEKTAKADASAWKTKKWAEGMWVEAVVRERLSMVSEMEQVEYARV
ncbi:uncharacterized protein PAC_15738 [Phialocephala subalpina]|uniref:RBR-type E3 ubiquitin transferase n=1 Tax=Phialocephala subalpina TaxID=576137 RepID=A0A1L7XLE3_9HELO|nr:uncharacterized protein PAC_15738 [Phialocephala subalpina]